MSGRNTERDAISRYGSMVAGNIPTTRQAVTSSALGSSIQRGGSCGFFGRSSAGGPKNTCRINRNEYATLNVPQITTIVGKPIRVITISLANVVSAQKISLARTPL